MASAEASRPSKDKARRSSKDARHAHRRREGEERKSGSRGGGRSAKAGGSGGKADDAQHRGWRLMPDFACKLAFGNQLPAPPSGPYLEDLPVDLSSFVAYKTTSLETSHKWELHAAANVGVRLDIVEPMAYRKAKDTPLAPADQEIIAYVKGKSAMKGSQSNVSWLVKGTHTHNNLYENVHKFKAQEGNQRGEYDLSERKKTEHVENPHDLGFIRSSFGAMQQRPQHPDKPGLAVASEMPFLPDEDHWATVFQDVVLDDDPTESLADGPDAADAGPEAKRRRLAESVLLNAKSVEGKFGRGHFYGEVFVPTKVPEPGVAMELAHARDYVFNVSTYDVPKYVCVLDEDASEALYCELPTKINFTKGRNARDANAIILSTRDPNEKEVVRKRGREAMLRIAGRDWREDEAAAHALEEAEAKAFADATASGSGATLRAGPPATAEERAAAGERLFTREDDDDEDAEDDSDSDPFADADDRGGNATGAAGKARGNGAASPEDDTRDDADAEAEADDTGGERGAGRAGRDPAKAGSSAPAPSEEAESQMDVDEEDDDEAESTF